MLNPPEPHEWIDDDVSDHCLICGSEFSFFNRRHHCRACGSLVCGQCSSKTATFYDEKKKWTSSQRVCDSCARGRDVEVLIGNRFHEPPGKSGDNNGVGSGMITIVLKSLSGIGPSSSWGGDLNKDISKSRSFSCHLSIGGKSLGQTTTKKWNPEESQGFCGEKLLTSESGLAVHSKRLNSLPSVLLRRLPCFLQHMIYLMPSFVKIRSGLGASESVVGYLRCPITGIQICFVEVGGCRRGWCMVLGSWRGSSLHTTPPQTRPLIPFSQNYVKSTPNSTVAGSETHTISRPELRSPVGLLHLDLFSLPPPPKQSNLTSWSSTEAHPGTSFPVCADDLVEQVDISKDFPSHDALASLMKAQMILPDVNFPVSAVPFGSKLSSWLKRSDMDKMNLKGKQLNESLTMKSESKNNNDDDLNDVRTGQPFVGYHLGLLINWFTEGTSLHERLFRKFGPNKTDVIPQNEYALETVLDAEMRWGNSPESSLGRGALLLTTHRLLFLQSADVSKHPVVVIYLPTVKTSQLKRQWKGLLGQTAIEVICTDSRSYLFLARDHENVFCRDHRAHSEVVEANLKHVLPNKKTIHKETSAESSNSDTMQMHDLKNKSTREEGGEIVATNSELMLVESKLAWIQQSMHWLIEEDNFSSQNCYWDLKDTAAQPTQSSTSSSSSVRSSSNDDCKTNIVNKSLNNEIIEKRNLFKADYDARQEFIRLGIIDESDEPAQGLGIKWHQTNANNQFELCPSYPAQLVIPTLLATDILKDQIENDQKKRYFQSSSSNQTYLLQNKTKQVILKKGTNDNIDEIDVEKDTIEDDEQNDKVNDVERITDEFLLRSCQWRTMRRLPVLTWLNQRSGAPIVRSSQPMVGLAGNSCLEDELLLMSVRATATGPSEEFMQACNDAYLKDDDDDDEEEEEVEGEKLKKTDVFRKRKRGRRDMFGKPSSLTSHLRGSSDSEISHLSSSRIHQTTSSQLRIGKTPLFENNLSDSTASLCYEWTELVLNKDDEQSPQVSSFRRSRSAPGDSSSSSSIGIPPSQDEEDDSNSRLDRLSESPIEVSLPLPCPTNEEVQVIETTSDDDDDDKEEQGTEKQQTNSHEEERGEEILLEESVVLRILDARPLLSAKANAAMGKGHEVVKRLGGERCTTLSFLGLPNIHAVRDAFEGLMNASAVATITAQSHPNLLRHALPPPNYSNSYHDAPLDMSGNSGQPSTGTHSSMSPSGGITNQWSDQWISLISHLIAAATSAAQHSEVGDPVLIHCSDGWDRTAQVASLATFLLDPHYRTIEGFQTLVEKDWCAFGHQFRWRCSGAGANSATPSVIDGGGCSSPIFIQWLDAVWQIKQQFPTHVEFNDDLLLLLAEATYSRTFSNFRDNCDSERYKQSFLYDNVFGSHNNIDQSISIWKHIKFCRSKYVNDLYLGYPQVKKSSVRRPVLRPSSSISSLSVWRVLLTFGSPLKPPKPPREELLERTVSTYRHRIEALLELLASKGLSAEADEAIASISI